MSDANRPAQSLSAGQVVSHYRLVERIGEGGMGVVWKATDTMLDRPVALKFLSPRLTQEPHARARFLREARAASALDHPNIGTIHEAGEHDGELFIAMAYYEGETLARAVKEGALELGEAARIFEQVAEGLAAAHAAGIVHRDIKPGNVMLTHGDQVKILDFGLAKLAPVAGEADTRLTVTGGVMGTVMYMSPEQAKGEPVDHRTDLWSLGVMAYEMIAGVSPFSAPSAASTTARILTEEPRRLGELRQGVPPALAQLVESLLRKDRSHRVQTAAELRAALARVRRTEFGSDLGTQPPPVKLVPRRRRLPVRRLLLGGLVGSLTAAMAVASIWLVPAAQRWLPPAAQRLLASKSHRPSLVTLPCRIFGPPENAFLTTAVPRTLTRKLTTVSGLDTRLPPTNLQVDPYRADLIKVARAYGVEACLICSVIAEANQIVVNVALVDPQGGQRRWARKFEAPRDRYLDLVHEIAEGVRSALAPSSDAISAASASTSGSEAELALQKGGYYSNLYRANGQKEAYETAYSAFERALELDPTFAQAAAEIAWLSMYRLDRGAPADEVLPQVDEWAQRALQLDARCGLAWAALSWAEIERRGGDWRKRLEYGLRAAALTLFDARVHDALAHSPLRNVSFSLPLAVHRAADRLDPLYVYPKLNEGFELYYLGRLDDAAAVNKQAMDLEPESLPLHQQRVLIMSELGRPQDVSESYARLQAAVAQGRHDPYRFLLAEHALAWARGERESAEAAWRRIHDWMSDPETSDHDLTFIVDWGVPPLARHGEVDRAVEIVLLAADRGSPPIPEWIELNPSLISIRTDSRLAAPLELSRRNAEEVLQILLEARARDELPSYLEEPLDQVLNKRDQRSRPPAG